MKRTLETLIVAATIFALVRDAKAAEVCGNGFDDDNDGLQDEGCTPGLTTGICESPLSCNDTGMVSPLLGALRYQLPPDIAPKVPYGPGIGFRRFYASQYSPGAWIPPKFQAAGSAISGTGAVSPSWPTHVAGDVALLIVETAGTQPASLSVAAGFTLLGSQADSVDINGTILTIYWKQATTSSEAIPTVADSGDHQMAQIVTFRDVATSSPIEAAVGDATSGTGSTSVVIPGTTAASPNSLVVLVTASSLAETASGWTNANLLNLTERVDSQTTIGNDGSLALATGVNVPAGPYGGTNVSLTSGSGTPRSARMSIVFRSRDYSTGQLWKKPLGDRWHLTDPLILNA